MKNLATALVKAQSEMSNPKKGNTNPFFKSKYADLNSVREAVIPVLNANGISVLQPMVNIDGKNFIKTILVHESGEMLESFTEIVYAKQNDAQAQGSGITYARRYGLQSFACVGADDDDGNAASQPQVKYTTNNFIKQLKNDMSIAEIQKKLDGCKTIDELNTLFPTITPMTEAIKAMFSARKIQLK
jgi:hypothetical protein